MLRNKLSVTIAVGILACCTRPALGGAYRRVLFEHDVPLGEEAPSVVIEGQTAAFADGGEIKFIDLRTGQVKDTVSVNPGGAKPKGLAWAKVLGMVDGRAYACIRHFTDPAGHAPPGGNMARVGGGIEPGKFQFVEVTIKGGASSILNLPPDAEVADRLLEKNLVYTHRGELHIVPLDGKNEQKFKLKGTPIWRPQVRGRDVIGKCDGSAYFYRVGDAAPKEITYRGTGLDVLIGASTAWGFIERTDDSIIVSAQKHTVCCDLDGKLRWKMRHRGRVAVGPKDEILLIGHSILNGQGSIMRLAPEDGEIIWRRCLAPVAMYVGGGSTGQGAVQVVGGRLVIVSSGSVPVLDPKGVGFVIVIDPADGEVVMDMPHYGRRLKRRSHIDGIPLTHMAVSGNSLVVGFETWIFGVDLTPTSQVPDAAQASDPANAAAEVQAFYKKHGAQATPGFNMLPKWGMNMADTPEAARLLGKPMKMLIGGPQGPVTADMVAGFCWLKDPMIPQSMSLFLKNKKKQDNNKGVAMVNMLGCHPDQKAALAGIKEILANPDNYTAKIREAAAEQMRIMEGPEAAPPADDLKLLYGTDHAKTIEVFRKKLRAADRADKLNILEVLKAAADEVLVGLASDISSLPDGLKMVQEARERIKALDRMGK